MHTVAEVGLDVVQLHGDEPPEFARQLSLRVIKALPYSRGEAARLIEYRQRCAQPDAAARFELSGLLIDASVDGRYGGTGETVDWDGLAAERSQLDGTAWWLAGGLHAGNVAAAIAAVRTPGVDVASGVETTPGVKDAKKVRDFVDAARAALAAD